MKTFLNATIGVGALLCGSTTVLACLPEYSGEATYEIIAVRAASDVAAVLPPEGSEEEVIGQTITLDGDGLVMDGASCDDWQRSDIDGPLVNTQDPMLADVMLGPNDGVSVGDARLMTAWRYECEGERVMDILQVDERVLIIPWSNGTQYLIAEKPLTESQMLAFERQLKDMKFLEGEPDGVFDEQTRHAISYYASYRVGGPDAYAFHRAAITENLLDGLNVLAADD